MDTNQKNKLGVGSKKLENGVMVTPPAPIIPHVSDPNAPDHPQGAANEEAPTDDTRGKQIVPPTKTTLGRWTYQIPDPPKLYLVKVETTSGGMHIKSQKLRNVAIREYLEHKTFAEIKGAFAIHFWAEKVEVADSISAPDSQNDPVSGSGSKEMIPIDHIIIQVRNKVDLGKIIEHAIKKEIKLDTKKHVK